MIYALVLALLWAGYAVWRIWLLARFFQLEGYQTRRYFNWLKASRARYASNRMLAGATLGIGGAVLLDAVGLDAPLIHLVWWAAIGLVITYPAPVKEVKKRFVRTQRATRLVGTAFALAVIFNLGLGAAIGDSTPRNLLFISLGGMGIIAIAFGLLPLANGMMYPVEDSLRRGFREKARRKLEQTDVKVIGITGSYGKTSTKVYLAHILGGRFRVLATPKSYNTLMGVCIVINNDLTDDYEFFITEMGAYIRGEIKEICELVHPEVGILIAIGPQHLERFGSLENIELAKYELIAALPQDGIGVFNGDDERVNKMAQRPHPNTRYTVSVKGGEDARFVAENIRHTVDGLAFDVRDRVTNDQRTFNTRLIGLHNVTNIMLAVAVARHYGMSLNEIAMRVATLEPEEHRLNRRLLPNGVTILDDAYNSNPIGAANALEVLALYQGRRILITPGMVELGELHDQENEKLGQLAAQTCTDIVLVGDAQTQPIQRGVRSTAFNLANLHIFDTTQAAIEWYQNTVQTGDAVLFLNDLSDNYL